MDVGSSATKGIVHLVRDGVGQNQNRGQFDFFMLRNGTCRCCRGCDTIETKDQFGAFLATMYGLDFITGFRKYPKFRGRSASSTRDDQKDDAGSR